MCFVARDMLHQHLCAACCRLHGAPSCAPLCRGGVRVGTPPGTADKGGMRMVSIVSWAVLAGSWSLCGLAPAMMIHHVLRRAEYTSSTSCAACCKLHDGSRLLACGGLVATPAATSGAKLSSAESGSGLAWTPYECISKGSTSGLARQPKEQPEVWRTVFCVVDKLSGVARKRGPS
jgi:hypothetical protein